MRVVDFAHPRRKEKLSIALGDEYFPIGDPHHVPSGDYYLVPASWWYKAKDKRAIKCANRFEGTVILMDFAREMAQRRRCVSGIKAGYVALLGDQTPNPLTPIRWSQPEFDPSPEFRRNPLKKHVLVTMNRPKGKVVTSLISELHGYHIFWKMRKKYADALPYYRKLLKASDVEIVGSEERDYNWPRPLVERYAEKAEFHVHIECRSTANQEMVRFGVPTYIWNGKRLCSHPMIEETRKWYDGRPADYCTQNLVRFMRENLSSH